MEIDPSSDLVSWTVGDESVHTVKYNHQSQDTEDLQILRYESASLYNECLDCYSSHRVPMMKNRRVFLGFYPTPSTMKPYLRANSTPKPNSYFLDLTCSGVKTLNSPTQGSINIPFDFDGRFAVWMQISKDKVRRVCILDCENDTRNEQILGSDEVYSISNLKLVKENFAVFVKDHQSIWMMNLENLQHQLVMKYSH